MVKVVIGGSKGRSRSIVEVVIVAAVVLVLASAAAAVAHFSWFPCCSL